MLRLLRGHVLDRLGELPASSVHCVVTSPPYYGLRDYGLEPQVWGGEPGCGHEWGEDLTSAQRMRNGDGASTLTNAKRNAPTGKGTVDVLHPSQGAFCRQCGAWRGNLGLEPTLDLYLDHMVEICREIRRVLRRDGTFWLNIGDSYAGSWGAQSREHAGKHAPNASALSADQIKAAARRSSHTGSIRAPGLKPKDLMLVPHRLALRLQEDGWWVRSEIVWAKDAPMPESCTDRPTSAHEKIWLLTKSARYFYDAEAVKEEAECDPRRYDYAFFAQGTKEAAGSGRPDGASNTAGMKTFTGKRNMRNVWRLPPAPFPEAHFATFPPDLPRRCILAGTSARGVCPKCGAPWERTIGWRPTCRCFDPALPAFEHDGNRINLPIPATILDPFLGAGTTAMVADQLQRNCIGIDLSPTYAAMAERRIRADNSLFAEIAAG